MPDDTVHRSKTIKLDQEIAALEGQLTAYDALWERLEALRERKRKLEQSNITQLRRQWPWHSWVMRAGEIRFIRGRLHFDERGPAPFPSCIVVFRGIPLL